MAFGPEYVTGLAGALRKILPLRVSRIEGGDTWTALKTQGEQWLILSWTSGAAGICTASQSEFNALKDISPSKASISDALKSRLTHGGEIFSVRQINNDRVLELSARRRVSAGLSVNYYLVLEITEPVANFLLLDENRKIDEAARHSTPDTNRFRTILPGHSYTPPPVFDGIDLHTLRTLRADDVQNLRGIGRPLARLILSHWEEHDAVSWKSALLKLLDEDSQAVCRVINKNGYITRLDFPLPEMRALGDDVLKAAGFGVIRPLLQRGRDKKLHEIDAKIKRAVKSRERHKDGLTKQLKECREAEIFRKKGEMILAHIYEIPKRAENITLTDWDGQQLAITLDPELSPSRNAEKYFKRYRKAKGSPDEITAKIQAVVSAIDELNEQHALLDSIDDPENFTQALKDLDEWVSQETHKAGTQSSGRHKKPKPELPPHLSLMKDGVNILVGLSARGNRYVTLKAARPEDIWLHAHEMPGAHVIIRGVSRAELEGSRRSVLEYAASLAAKHSSGKGAGSVPVDYTEKKYVRSVPGTVALVTYTNPGTLRISPELN